MAKTYDGIDESLSEWMSNQPLFFVSTAPLDPQGSVNCSPKGNRDEFAVLGARTVAFLDQTGSGVETIAHLRENGRIVIMLCAFAGPPRIVRLHGTGRVVLADDPDFEVLAANFPQRGRRRGPLGHRRRRAAGVGLVWLWRAPDDLGGSSTDYGPVVRPQGEGRGSPLLGREERHQH